LFSPGGVRVDRRQRGSLSIMSSKLLWWSMLVTA
jgi:hypothetical protein